MFKKVVFIFILFLASVSLLFSYDPYFDYKSNIEKKYKLVNNLSFWINNTKELDKVFLDKKQIPILNKIIKALPESTVDIFDNFAKKTVELKIVNSFHWLCKRNIYFYKTGLKISNKQKLAFQKKLNLKKIPFILKQNLFAVTVTHAYLYAIPVNYKIVYFNLNQYFNRNIETVLHINELLRVLNISSDKKWYFVASSYCFGWVKASDIAIVENINFYKKFNKKFAVVLKNFESFKLGDIIPYYKNNFYIPVKSSNKLIFKKTKIKAEYINVGFLALTRRNVLTLVFNIIKSDYKWGGASNQWDCSLFVMDIFRCFGIQLPRNSKKQSEVPCSINIAKLKDKKNIIKNFASPCLSLIYSYGHIMLYLGSIGGKVYIAHDFTMLDYKRGELLVTDLNFGRLNFKNRIKKVIILAK